MEDRLVRNLKHLNNHHFFFDPVKMLVRDRNGDEVQIGNFHFLKLMNREASLLAVQELFNYDRNPSTTSISEQPSSSFERLHSISTFAGEYLSGGYD